MFPLVLLCAHKMFVDNNILNFEALLSQRSVSVYFFVSTNLIIKAIEKMKTVGS